MSHKYVWKVTQAIRWKKKQLKKTWTSSRLSFRFELLCKGKETKAIKASAIYTFPKQDCGIHFPSLEWDLHGDADITRLGEILSSACVMRFSLQEHPLAMK